jgi:deoxyribodipyrimidine photo-lyase
MEVVWFKRDLRLRDQPAVAAALKSAGPQAFVYIWEPELLAHPTWGEMHTQFVAESLDDLRAGLRERGADLWEFTGEVEAVFAGLLAGGMVRVHSSQETGVGWTFERDRRMARWFRAHGVGWVEHIGCGVVRGARDRQDWLARWQAHVEAPEWVADWSRLRPAGSELPDGIDMGAVRWGRPAGAGLGPGGDGPEPAGRDRLRQPGGERWGHAYLRTFLAGRARQYAASISKPEASRTGCSRISPYLAWGNLSIRTAYQAARAAAGSPGAPRRALRAFTERLRWRDHFTQKFESECRMEWEDVNRALGALARTADPARVAAWEAGRTGVPLVDACMRCLTATGYVNFRMRAMLVSYLTHHLWQPWQAGSDHLARIMLDFEPGIHYPQMQMQAGCTGLNTVRIYNPVKQAQDHDPEGHFIRKWVPELAALPTPALFAPWEMPPLEAAMYGVQPGVDYPLPLVELEAAARHARERLWGEKKSPAAREEGARILRRHVLPKRKAGKGGK